MGVPYFDKKLFNKRCNEMCDDVECGNLRSKSWIYVAAGAVVGLISSCVRMTKNHGKPIIGRIFKKEGK